MAKKETKNLSTEEIIENLLKAEAASKRVRQLKAKWEMEREMTRRKVLDDCPIKSGMTVVRKRDKQQVRGKVYRVFLYDDPDVVKNRYVWRPRCRVKWEGATNGTKRFRGGEWSITSTVLASSLKKAI